ncbi:MAG: hypothetical protein SFU25_09375 [Candidatus Caenarcaniphilales bacterium]|nr:hypothetical protein [Candidatus Caenarcaniphilales bacterium]
MSEEIPIDAEGSTRNKNYGPGEHLQHLIKIGYELDSSIIKTFVETHSLHEHFEELKRALPKG